MAFSTLNSNKHIGRRGLESSKGIKIYKRTFIKLGRTSQENFFQEHHKGLHSGFIGLVVYKFS